MIALYALADSIVAHAALAGLAVVSVAEIACFVRLWIGPSLADRIAALDMQATLLVGLLALSAITMEESYPLRVATVLALVNFVGAVAFSLYRRQIDAS